MYLAKKLLYRICYHTPVSTTKLFAISTCISILFFSLSTFTVVANRQKPTILNPLSKIQPSPTTTPTNTPTPTQTPTPTNTPTPTIIPTPAPVTAPSDLNKLFVQYANEYSISTELLKRIAKCESNFNPGANAHGYGGLFQFSETLWNQTRTLLHWDTNPNLRFNAEEAIKTAAFMVSQNHLGIWPNCGK